MDIQKTKLITGMVMVLMSFILCQVNTVQAQQQLRPLRDTVFFEKTTARCNIKASFEPRGHALRINMDYHLVGVNCAFSKQQTVKLFSSVLKAHKESGDKNAYHSLMVGRVEDYAWMQRYLTDTARNDVNWSQETGKPVKKRTNNYVNSILSSFSVMAVFNLAGEKHGYKFSAMDCEKVFISDKGLPYDAFCWIKMEQK